MNNLDWLERLQTLSERFSYLGMGADVSALSIIEAWGVYRYLSRVNGGE